MTTPHAASVSAPLSTFRIDPPAVAALTGRLRADAAALRPVQLPDVPAIGPLAAFAAALAGAVDSVNGRTTALRTEAERLADVMDTTTRATVAVDSSLGRALGVTQP